MEKIYGYYPIVDCENEGDIRTAEKEVQDAGGIVDKVISNPKDTDEEIDDYYESKEWCIAFYCNSKTKLVEVCKKLGMRA